jgi:Zn-dependent protease
MSSVTNTLFEIAALLVPLTIAIVFHEVAHGRVAKMFGDMTASNAGRLSLNPIRHIDPFGTIILPTMLALGGAPMFGWAKPVPVRQSQLRNPRWHMVLVAAAGPASNIVLAVLTAIAFGLIVKLMPGNETMATAFILKNLTNFIAINLFLALFNLIPMPPFDGSKILAGFLPEPLASKFQSLDRYALLFMIGLLFVVPLLFPSARIIDRIVGPPFAVVAGWMDAIVQAVVG